MAHGKVITGVVRSGRKAVGYLRKTVVYHDGRVVPLGQGRLFGASMAGSKLIRSGSVRFSSGPVRSVKRDNAENQRARIAPGLDRHGIVWPGCRSGGRDRLPAGRWCVRRCRKVGHRWRELCACHSATLLPFGVRCVCGVNRGRRVFARGVVYPVGEA